MLDKSRVSNKRIIKDPIDIERKVTKTTIDTREVRPGSMKEMKGGGRTKISFLRDAERI